MRGNICKAEVRSSLSAITHSGISADASRANFSPSTLTDGWHQTYANNGDRRGNAQTYPIWLTKALAGSVDFVGRDAMGELPEVVRVVQTLY